MGCGYAPNAAYVMTWNSVKAIVPESAQQFEETLSGNTIDDYCKGVHIEDLTEVLEFTGPDDEHDAFIANVEAAWRGLILAFESVTRTDGQHLSIEPGFHSSDDGDRYDDPEVNGGFFYVDGVHALTPAGERFKDHVQFAQWTEFG